MIAKTAFLAHSLAGALATAQPTAPLPARPPAPLVMDHTTPTDHFTASGRLIENGIATWYGQRGSKHYTASGERFLPYQLTAAHRSIPLGTMVRVTDRSTGRSVVVKVNDREPPHGIRCIDLSEGAAIALGIHSQGLARVTITALAASEPVEVAEAPAPGERPAIVAAVATAQAALHRRHTRLHTRH